MIFAWQDTDRYDWPWVIFTTVGPMGKQGKLKMGIIMKTVVSTTDMLQKILECGEACEIEFTNYQHTGFISCRISITPDIDNWFGFGRTVVEAVNDAMDRMNREKAK